MKGTKILKRKTANVPKMQRERLEQKRFVSWCRLQYPKLVIAHFANGGARDPREGRHFKEMGVLAGMPDLIIFRACGVYNGLLIEMKAPAPHSSRIDKKQVEVMKALDEENYLCKVAYGADDAEQILKEYLSLVDISDLS